MKRSGLIFVVSLCIAIANRGFSQNAVSMTVIFLGNLPQCAQDIKASLPSDLAENGSGPTLREDITFGDFAGALAGKPDDGIFSKFKITGSHVLAVEILPDAAAPAPAGAVTGASASAPAAALTPAPAAAPDGAVAAPGLMCTVRAYLYSMADRSFVYITDEHGRLPDDTKKISAALAGRTRLFIQNKLVNVAGLSAANQDPLKDVTLSWESAESGVSYRVLRSVRLQDPAEVIGDSASPAFTDTTGEPGVIYYYRVCCVVGGVACDPSPAVRGFRRSAAPASEDLDAILKARKIKYPEVTDPVEKAKVEMDHQITDQFHVNLFSVNFILNIIRKFLKSGQVIALSNVAEYRLDRANRTIYLIYPGRCVIRFYSGRLFRLYNQCPPTSEPLTLTFGPAGSAKNYLGAGWVQPTLMTQNQDEPLNWTGTDGSNAEIKIPLRTGGRPAMIDLFLSKITLGGPNRPVRVDVTVNDSFAAFFAVKETGRYSVSLPYDRISEGESVTVGFHFFDRIFRDASDPKYSPQSNFSVGIERMLVYPYIESNDLFKRLIENSVTFALPTGVETELMLKSGVAVSLPMYDGVGMATQYYRDSVDWKNDALLFDSSDENIRKKIKEAAKSVK